VLVPYGAHPNDPIGSAIVRRPFSDGADEEGRQVRHKVGEVLAMEQIMAWSLTHRSRLIQQGFIAAAPPAADAIVVSGGPTATISREPPELFVVHLGSGQYDVIEGWKKNDRPLTRREAEDLAGGL